MSERESGMRRSRDDAPATRQKGGRQRRHELVGSESEKDVLARITDWDRGSWRRSGVGKQSGNEPLVSINAVSKIYSPYPPLMKVLLRSSIKSPIVALEDVTIDVAAGHILAIVGPNGAGKSTLFRILTGLTTPTSGFATICGLDVTKRSFEVRRRLGFAPAEEHSLLLRHTCKENLVFHGRLQGIPARVLNKQVERTLGLVGLEKARNRAGIALSAGMKSRLIVARALLHRPEVLILDEPTGKVDPVAAYEVLEIIREIVAESGIAALISSHRLEEIEALHDNVMLLDQGRVVHKGDLDSLRREWDQGRIEIVFGTDEEAALARETVLMSGYARVADQQGPVLLVATDKNVGTLLALLGPAASGIRSIQEMRLPLRDLLARMLIPTVSQHS